MTRRIRFISLSVLLACLALPLGPRPARSQVPDKFTNLKVLPKDISKDQLIGIMRDFSSGLGVRCEHCHVDDDSKTPRRVDFASDEKKEKGIARGMMAMAKEINRSLLPKTGVESPTGVRCVTCHHGLPRPETLADALEGTIQKEGVSAAQAKYRELREQYYGSGAYDFRPASLARVADWLAHERKDPDGAISILQFSIGIDPNAAATYGMLAQIQGEKGDKAAAIASARKALELEPDNPRYQHQLQVLESGK